LILRVLQGRVIPGQTAAFREQAQQTLDDARRHDGLIYAQVGRQVNSDGGEEVVFVSAWRDLEALYRWLGGTDLLVTPVVGNGRASVFAYFEVQHYESYETAAAEALEGEESPRAASSAAPIAAPTATPTAASSAATTAAPTAAAALTRPRAAR
jgi:heme-degrading monooxygenase HmoA